MMYLYSLLTTAAEFIDHAENKSGFIFINGCLYPGNASLLRWWFRDRNVTLIRDKSLRVDVTYNVTAAVTQIYVEGLRY